mgnify:CR=1 FL=1
MLMDKHLETKIVKLLDAQDSAGKKEAVCLFQYAQLYS